MISSTLSSGNFPPFSLANHMRSLSPSEFEESARKLVEWAKEYNESATVPIACCLKATPQESFITTASVYLTFASGIQVFYSPAYQLPVLYLPVNHVLDSDAMSARIFGDGQMLSYTENPINGLPCLSMHPCNTAQILEELAPTNATDALFKWLGFYNHKITPAFSLPLEFFAFISTKYKRL